MRSVFSDEKKLSYRVNRDLVRTWPTDHFGSMQI